MEPEGIAELEQRLERGDLELRFHDGRATRAHCLQLALASSVLQNLMDDVGMVDQSASCKRKRPESAAVQVSSLKVSPICMWGPRAKHPPLPVLRGGEIMIARPIT